ncbi:hypothetical protein F0562_028796 [Nyssa sinensis]|uniref:Squalene monooxygenase n=1 Tax=Nyssa sinensis TaxID=561372 RepID=A0A5J5B143_9ASTE|nr:hypothetical protein F0562_028796 [Nyssa sinensis]
MSIAFFMDLKMIDHYIFAGVTASLFGFVLLYSLQSKKKNRNRASMGFPSHRECVKSSGNGECHPEDIARTDVIIVGAGVAGAALAYSLAKGFDMISNSTSYVLERTSFVKLEQGTVTSLIENDGTIKGVQYKTESGQEMTAYAPLTIVCDGCFSNLRRSLCKPKVDVPSCFVGLVLQNCQLPYANHGHVILADPSPILFYPISSTEIRCLVDVPGQKVPSISNGEMAHYLKTKVAPQIPPELYSAFISAIDKGNIRSMLNRTMPAAPHPTPGCSFDGGCI